MKKLDYEKLICPYLVLPELNPKFQSQSLWVLLTDNLQSEIYFIWQSFPSNCYVPGNGMWSRNKMLNS